MGIREIGLTSYLQNYSSNEALRIYSDSDYEGTYLSWITDAGSETHQSFTVSLSWSGVAKGQSQTTPLSEAITKTFPAAQLHEHTNPTRAGTIWTIGLSAFDGLMAKLGNYTGDKITYDGRNYDYLTFNFSVCANYANPEQWGADSSPTENSQSSLIFVPEYVITDVYYDTPDLIVVEYTAEGWTRNDDRWGLDKCKFSDGSAWFTSANSILAGNTYGQVAKLGRIEMPATAFTKSVMNKNVRMVVRWVANYLPIGFTFAMDTVEIGVDSKIVKNTPTLSVASNDGRTIELNVGDSGDKGAEIDTITVKMENGKYALDTVTVTKEGSTWPQATFKYCPYNTQLTFTAIGTKGQGASAPKSISGIILSNRNRTSFDAIDGDTHVDLYQDIQTDISTANNHTNVQFAGRRRPSAFYGTGGTTSLSFSASMLFDDASDFLALAQAELEGTGDVMVRLPDGKRYAMAVKSCDVSWTLRNQKEVTISGEEVDA